MEVNISANTLFHFTPSKKGLLNILENGFYVRYSLENYENLIDGHSEICFPMVSFCDIPLSQIKKHTKTYGSYAIGLSKKWGMKKKINPVIYSYANSTTAEILNELAENLESFFQIKDDYKDAYYNSKSSNNNKEGKLNLSGILDELAIIEKDPHFKYTKNVTDKIQALRERLSAFLKYIKPYTGKSYRGNDYLPYEVNFYEEREWRFVPTAEQMRKAKRKDSYDKEYYINPIKRRAINMKLAKHIKLDFMPADIRFIIVHKEKEIAETLQEIEEIFDGRIKQNEIKLLVSRIISLEQVIEDI